MGVLFKIFVFLMLKGGAGVLKNDTGGLAGTTNIQTYAMPQNTVLHIQGDPIALEDAVTICQAFGPVHINRENNSGIPESSRVAIQFEHLNEDLRTRISHQIVLQLTGRVLVEWKDNIVTNI